KKEMKKGGQGKKGAVGNLRNQSASLKNHEEDSEDRPQKRGQDKNKHDGLPSEKGADHGGELHITGADSFPFSNPLIKFSNKKHPSPPHQNAEEGIDQGGRPPVKTLRDPVHHDSDQKKGKRDPIENQPMAKIDDADDDQRANEGKEPQGRRRRRPKLEGAASRQK